MAYLISGQEGYNSLSLNKKKLMCHSEPKSERTLPHEQFLYNIVFLLCGNPTHYDNQLCKNTMLS